MLFNLDKQTKKNILEYYKQEALNNRLKKQEERKRELDEERNSLQQKEIRQKKTIDMMNKEIQYNKNKLKEEYNLMLQKTKGYFPRKSDIIINNWGLSKEPFILPEIKRTPPINNYNANSFLNNNRKNEFRELSPLQKEKEILKQVDHMDEYLTDKQNLNEVKRYFLKEKENRYNFYKDLLYSQYKNAHNKNLNLYGTKDQLILKQRKKKFISDNPYIRKRKYESGSSSLEHNPIVNPENNYNYNKYINYKNFALNFFNTNNNNRITNDNNFNNYLYSVQNNNSEINNTNNILNEENNVNNNNILNNISNKSYTINPNKKFMENETSCLNNKINNSNYRNNNKVNSSELNSVTKTQRNIRPEENNLKRNFSQGDIYY